jgi:hypothetical protein
MIRSNCLVRPGGSFNAHKKCRGIDEIAELINCNLAPWERKLELAESFLSSLQTKGDNSEIVGFVVPTGNPK